MDRVRYMLMVSTLTLGWHFLTDVVAGLMIAAGAIYVAEICLPKEKIAKKAALAFARTLRQGLNRQPLNDYRKYNHAIGHR